MADSVERKRQALGRGLAALIPTPEQASGLAQRQLHLPIEKLRPLAGGQLRRSFDETRLAELAASIKEHGVLQPLLVRPVAGGYYEIIAGERRWRAAQRAGLLEVPVIVRDRVGSDVAFEMALVENLQRDDLNPIEVAEGYRRLLEEFRYTQEKLAQRVGKDRSTVANSLRLLKLPDRIQHMTATGRLSEGHARALLAMEDDPAAMLALAERAVRESLSVRQVERLARRTKSARREKAQLRESPDTRALVERLQRALGTRVRLTHRAGRGKLELFFSSLAELEMIIDRLL